MSRKVRHPYQILEASELIKDELYSFITADQSHKSGTHYSVDTYIFGGTFKDSKDIIKNPPKLFKQSIVTIHLDGVYPDMPVPRDKPLFVYWRNYHNGWDNMSTYLGDIDIENLLADVHHIIVSQKHWADDSKIHVLDWKNPDDVIKRKIHVFSNIDMNWEQRINVKRDNALAYFFGFKR